MADVETGLYTAAGLREMLAVAAAAYLLAAGSGVSFAVYCRRAVTCWELVSVGLASGTLGLCLVAFFLWAGVFDYHPPWGFAFVSLSVGPCGDPLARLPLKLLEKILAPFGVEIEYRQRDKRQDRRA